MVIFRGKNSIGGFLILSFELFLTEQNNQHGPKRSEKNEWNTILNLPWKRHNAVPIDIFYNSGIVLSKFLRRTKKL